MSDVLACWRVSYAPGSWIVLAGPTSLVVIQPLAAEWSALVDTLWQEVLACSSITELADQLVAFGIADMPSFAAFFWSADGMRSLVRGGVVVREVSTGRKVADGQGVQTWSEVGLAGTDHVRIELPRSEPGPMELPLLVGAAFASVVTLNASAGAQLRSSQGIPSAPETGAPAAEPATDEQHGERTLMEDASTELMPATPLAALALSDGQQLDLVGVVRIGRAPSGESDGGSAVQLVTVASPQQDISRTHVQIHPSGEQIVVTDLNSTNGTMLVAPDTETYGQRLPPGEPVAVPVGSLLDLGDNVTVSIEVPRGPSRDPLT